MRKIIDIVHVGGADEHLFEGAEHFDLLLLIVFLLFWSNMEFEHNNDEIKNVDSCIKEFNTDLKQAVRLKNMQELNNQSNIGAKWWNKLIFLGIVDFENKF